jgi:hypothetical protein
MKLVYEGTDKPVQIGDVVHVRNVPYYIENIVEPHKPASTGRVWCRSMDERKYFNEWFPSVIKAKWIDRTDQGKVTEFTGEDGKQYIRFE